MRACLLVLLRGHGAILGAIGTSVGCEHTAALRMNLPPMGQQTGPRRGQKSPHQPHLLHREDGGLR